MDEARNRCTGCSQPFGSILLPEAHCARVPPALSPACLSDPLASRVDTARISIDTLAKSVRIAGSAWPEPRSCRPAEMDGSVPMSRLAQSILRHGTRLRGISTG